MYCGAQWGGEQKLIIIDNYIKQYTNFSGGVMFKCRLQIWPIFCLQIVDKQVQNVVDCRSIFQTLKIVDCRLQDCSKCRFVDCILRFKKKLVDFGIFWVQIVDFGSFTSVKSVHVDFNDIELVIYIDLRLSKWQVNGRINKHLSLQI